MKNKAFTLVELLGVIVLLGILGIVIIPKVGDSITNSKETAYITQEETIKKAVNDFLVDNTDLLEDNDTITIKLGVLKQKGYLPVNIKNPKTRKNISNESLIIITKNGNTYDIKLNLIDLEDVTENMDNNSPILVLNGNYIEYVEVNDTYEEKGAIAKSSTGETISNISKQIKLDGVEKSSIDTSQLLTYNIIYSVTDSNGLTTSATRTVIVRDTKSPTITFPTETTLIANQVNGYDLRQSVIVSDNYDTNTTLSINSGLSNIPGKYVVTYTATDSSGNVTTERRVIKVESTPTYIIKGKTTPSSTATPTMDNPVTYYGLGRDNYIDVIETRGKNLFDEESILMAIEGATKENGHYVFGVGQAYAKYKDRIPTIKFKENTQYTMTIKGYSYGPDDNGNNGFTNFRIVFKYTDGTESFQKLNYKTETELTYTSTAGKTVERIFMYYGYGSQVYISHIQLEEGTTATEYEPYEGSTTRINLTGHDPLRCLDDICDYIDYDNSRIVRNVGKYTVTGNENWAYRNTTEDGISTYSITTSAWVMENMNYKYYSGTKSLNSYVQYDGTTTGVAENYFSSKHFTLYYNGTAPGSRAIYINSPISTLAEFKSKLQYINSNGYPMYIFYELAEPQFESIDLPQVNLYWNSNTFVTDGYVTKSYN